MNDVFVLRSYFDDVIDGSDTMSHTNTVEMISGRTGTDDSRSYSTYEKRSIEDYDDDYRRYDVSHTH